MKPERIEHPVLLLVEGKDAWNFFDALRSHLNLVDVEVRDFGGVDHCADISQRSCQCRDSATSGSLESFVTPVRWTAV